VISRLRDYIELTGGSYNPIFMNDAQAGEHVLQSYGDRNYHRLKEIQEKYDPKGFFLNRQGGFKFN